MKYLKALCLPIAALLLAGCSSVYYNTMEQFGIEKRDILVDRVEEARDSQEEAKEQFASALEQFTTLLNFDGGELQRVYDRLNTEFERSERRAEEVSDRIRAVENVSEDLFDEWEDELDLYTDQSLRSSSDRTLRQTRVRYNQLIATMQAAENTMIPVLNAFRDQVLFLRHNLNSQAIASLRSEVTSIESDIATLIDEMEASIAESNRFLDELQLI
ncbi:MAG: DUF2959 domain-containing protein [Gammaproteobacteria bacterium]|nr:DUF2959 domain-containing protein [Gammaproteobacteria bacterium]